MTPFAIMLVSVNEKCLHLGGWGVSSAMAELPGFGREGVLACETGENFPLFMLMGHLGPAHNSKE
jgi:hypothetical protein